MHSVDPTTEQMIRSVLAYAENRLRLLHLLRGGEVCVCDLTAAFDLSQPTISHHLRVLRDVGLVTAAKRGTWSYYRLVPDAVEPLRIALGARPPDGSAQS